MRIWRYIAMLLFVGCLAGEAGAQNTISNLPRNETLIAENPEGTIKNAGWFNIWAINAGGQSTGLHQLGMDTFWYIDPEKGIDGVWENSLAAEKPIYNADFTEMTVKLRRGIFWSDGVEFTADDVVYTIQTHMKTNGLRWSAPVQVNVADVVGARPRHRGVQAEEAQLALPRAVHRALERDVDDAEARLREAGRPAQVRLRPAGDAGRLHAASYDPNGKWFIWQRRADWQRTTRRRAGASPGRNYVAYIDPGPPDKRVIAQLNHQLDIIHDTSPEGMFTLAKQSKSSHGWFKGFPYAHPDPTLPAVIFNDQLDMFKSRDVRWALALLIDIKAVSMASYRGAATISAIGVPPTGSSPDVYHKQLEAWLRDFELDTGKRKIKPYDPDASARRSPRCCGRRWASRSRPIADEIANSFGRGWWKPNPQAAPELLETAGYSKRGDKWYMPDGKPFTIHITVEGEARPVMTRAGSMIAQEWRQFGIDATHGGRAGHHDRPPRRRRLRGDHLLERGDLGRPSRPVVLPRQLALAVRGAARQAAAAAQLAALVQSRSSTRSSSRSAPSASTIRRALELGLDYLKLAVREMPTIPLMSYNVFTVMDETYWTGYPNAETAPYTDPVPNWANTRYMMVKLKPRQ